MRLCLVLFRFQFPWYNGEYLFGNEKTVSFEIELQFFHDFISNFDLERFLVVFPKKNI